MKIIIIFLLTTIIAYSQLNDKVISIQNSSDSCANGQRVVFRDVNKDNQYEKIRRNYCDLSFDDDSLIILGKGMIESGMSGELINGKFSSKDFLIRLKDPFKNIILGYLYFDTISSVIVLDFNTAIDELSNKSTLSIYPNPLTQNEELTIRLKNLAPQEISFMIVDTKGERIGESKNEYINDENSGIIFVPVVNNSGLYFLRIEFHLIKEIILLPLIILK
jgi:hypothetical protein